MTASQRRAIAMQIALRRAERAVRIVFRDAGPAAR
jgi:hypothetical protein